MKKNNLTLLGMALTGMLCAFFSGCNTTPIINDGKTINIKSLEGGYGDTWLKELIKKFEAQYPDYKVNYLGCSTEFTGDNIVRELSSGYQGIDIYFTDNVSPKNVYNYVEDLTDLYDSKPISFNGTEETKTIREKMTSGYEDDQYKVDGKDYNFIFHKSIGGIVYNSEKLNSVLGTTVEPKTTNEFLKIIEDIYDQYLIDEGILPLTLVSKDHTNGYPACMAYALFAQYSGIEGWEKLWSLNTQNGVYDLTNGYKVYEDQGLLEMNKVLFRIFDKHYFKDDGDQSLQVAHQQLMFDDTGAIFMCDGDWARNEIINSGYTKQETSVLRFMNFPVISALGTKIWGEQKLTSEITDKALSKAVALCDEGKTAHEIACELSNDTELNMDCSDEEAEQVIKARGIFVSRGGTTGQVYLAKGSKVTDISKKFLRMFASDDNSKLYRETCNGCTPYDSDCGKSTVTDEYFKGFAKIATSQQATGIWPSAKGLRAIVKNGVGNRDFMPESRTYYVFDKIYSKGYSQYDKQGNKNPSLADQYDIGAKERFDSEAEFVAVNWSTWIAGISNK